MNSITNRTHQLKLYGAVAVLGALILTVLAVTMAGGVQAQSEAYADPHPCGPGFDEFYPLPEFPDDQVSAGRYAIFDAYYDLDADQPHRPTEEGDPWAGLLSLNFCPPTVEAVDDEGTITYTRDGTNIDINRTVFHVDQTAHTLTAAEAAAYPFLGDAGDEVYWLRVGDDPYTTSVIEQESDLRFSFSTALFDDVHWYREDDQGNSVEPLYYEIEAERELGLHPREYGHIYLFDASPAPGGEDKEAVWNSAESDTGRIDMQPGQYRELQWAFTKPGTYELSVHINAGVRQLRPDDLPEDEVWNPASEAKLVTSQVKRYTFQVGSLTLNEQPMFRAPDISVPENSAAGTLVGSPVPVYQADSDALTYELTGRGSGNFEVESTAQGGQIKVAAGGHLDYEAVQSYQLVLAVTDDRDRENNPDESVDHTIAVHIAVTDVADGPPPTVSISVNPTTESHSEYVTFTTSVTDKPAGSHGYTYTLWVLDGNDNRSWVKETGINSTFTVGAQGRAGTISYQVEVQYNMPNHPGVSVYSNTVSVVWQ